VYYDKPGWSEFKKASPCECEEFDTGRFQDWDLKFSRGPDTQMKCPKTTLSRTEDSSLTNHRHRKRGKWMGVKVQTHMVMPGASDKQPDCNYVLSQQSFHIWGHMQFMQVRNERSCSTLCVCGSTHTNARLLFVCQSYDA